MNLNDLTSQQKLLAIQRLTALWAFSESGLGGVLHALKVPFTGLVVGGMAIILITFISHLSENKNQLLKSLLIVLMVKAVVSPHTPFPAYIAVSFQAFLGYGVFSIFRINAASILTVSVIAMLESALQKLLVLTFFFGKSLWQATDELIKYISKQFSIVIDNGSLWLISIYVGIYFIGGILIAIITYRLLKGFEMETNHAAVTIPFTPVQKKKQNTVRRIFIIFCVALLISVILYFIPGGDRDIVSLIKVITWTISAIILWYMILSPLFTSFLQRMLQKNKMNAGNQLEITLAFFPELRSLSMIAWENSKNFTGWRRMIQFIKTMLHWSLTYSNQTSR